MAPKRCKNGTPSGTKKPKKTLAKPTKAKDKRRKVPVKPTKVKAKSSPAKTAKPKKGCVACPNCSGKGVVRKRKLATKKKTKRRLPENNHFPYFFCYCAQRVSDKGTRQSGKETMRQAGICWRELSPGQKTHFVNEIKPVFVRKRPPPPPPPPSSKRKSCNPGPSGSQPKFRRSDDDNDNSYSPSSGGGGSSGSAFVLSPTSGSLDNSVMLFVPGKSFP